MTADVPWGQPGGGDAVVATPSDEAIAMFPSALVDLATGCIVAANEALALALGRVVAELVGSAHRDLYDPASWGAVGEIGRLVGERGAVTLDGLRLRRGARAPALSVSVCAVLRTRPSGAHHARLIFTDTTERARLETALAGAQRLEAAGRAAAAVVHDLNDLLAVIDMAAFRAEASPADAPVSWALIHQAVREAAQLTGRLHEVSRGPAGADAGRTRLNATLQASAEALRELAAPARLRLRLEPELWSCTLPGEVARSVVAALVRSAVGTNVAVDAVLVETNNVAQTGEGTADVVALRVRADRRGVASPAPGGTFEPLPLEVTSCELASARAAVAAYDGQLLVYTMRGSGPLFEVRLPRVEAHRPGEVEGAQTAVLVVDDEPTIRAMVVRWLREHGYDVLEAADGADALAVMAASERRIDLLLSDVVMPGMSGPELAHQLRQGRPDLRVLFMSAHTASEVAWNEPSDGPLLEKPFRGAEVVARVAQALA